jgi:hypothetical protein
MVRFTGDAWRFRQYPFRNAKKLAHFSVRFSKCQISIFSLKAEAGSCLCAGKKALWFLLDRRADQAARRRTVLQVSPRDRKQGI